MKKNESGVLTIEASISLSIFALFVLFLFNFATIYRAENMISHATLQTADAVALESYLRETSFESDEQKVLFWANRINGIDTLTEDSFESLRTADLQSIAIEKFALAIGAKTDNADETLKKLGVKKGLAGIDLSESYVELTTNDVIIKANYTVRMKFPVFGATEIEVSKSAKAKTAGEILFGISVVPEQQIMGTTTGSGKYKMGQKVQILAEPNYGFDFVSWDDGNTENPRTVTVAEAKTYVAKFIQHNFGVNLFIKDNNAEGRTKGTNAYGKVSGILGGAVSLGGNEYPYESTVKVKAEANPGYKFVKWNGSKVVGSKVETIKETTTAEFEIFIDGTYDLTATYKPIPYTVNVTSNFDDTKNHIGVRKVGGGNYVKSVTVDYGTMIELNANVNIYGYTFKGWYKDNALISNAGNVKLSIPVGGGTYEARYEKDPVVTVVADGPGSVSISSNEKTTFACKKGSSVQVVATANTGVNCCFDSWSDGGERVHWITNITADITITAKFLHRYNISVTTEGGGTVSGGGANIKSGTTVTIKATPNTGYKFVKWQKSVNGGAYTDVSANATQTMIASENATYKAVFEKLFFTVTFDVNGGKKPIAPITVEYGATISNFQKPVPNGKMFSAWQLNGKTVNSVTVTSDITLKAVWKACTGHVWGHCGKVHTMYIRNWNGTYSGYNCNFKGDAHNVGTHTTKQFLCVVCVRCGSYSGGSASNKYSYRNLRIKDNNQNWSHDFSVIMWCGQCYSTVEKISKTKTNVHLHD